MTGATTVPWYREVSRGQWKSMFAAWIGYLLDGFDFVLITLVLTEIADEFDLSTASAASLVSGAFITRWLGGAVLGALGDRYGRKAAMIVSILLYSLGTFACGFAWNYISMFTARLVIGMGMAGEYSASATYVLESWPARLRNRASGFLISGYSGGTILASELYKWVVPHWGWRWMFWIGVLPVLVALWVRRALPEAGDWHEEVATAKARPNAFRPLFAGRSRASVNTALAVAASVALFLVFTPLGAGWRRAAVLLAAGCLVAFAAQLGGRRRWPLYVALTCTVFCAFLYSWPIQALLPTYLKEQLGYTPSEVTDVMFYAGFGTMAALLAGGIRGRPARHPACLRLHPARLTGLRLPGVRGAGHPGRARRAAVLPARAEPGDLGHPAEVHRGSLPHSDAGRLARLRLQHRGARRRGGAGARRPSGRGHVPRTGAGGAHLRADAGGDRAGRLRSAAPASGRLTDPAGDEDHLVPERPLSMTGPDMEKT